MKQQIMILAQNFPPYDGGRIGSSIRVYTMADFFARNGFTVHVVIPKRKIAARDDVHLHPDITVHSFFSLFQYYDHSGHSSLNRVNRAIRFVLVKFKSLLRRVAPFSGQRSNLSAKKLSTRLITIQNIQVVLSSSPPLWTAELARKLKKKYGDQLFWIHDFRDLSWMHPTSRKASPEKLENSERFLVEQADLVLSVSTGMDKVLRDKMSETAAARLSVVENGFALCEHVSPQPEFAAFAEEARRKGRIVLIYAGTGTFAEETSALKGNKTINCFIDPILENPLFSQKVALVLQGVINNAEEILRKKPDGMMILNLPPVSNEKMRANLKLADVGININVDSSYAPFIMGGKLYDYIASGLALLLLYPENAHSIKEFCRNHGEKPYFANVFDGLEIEKRLTEIISDPMTLDKRKFSQDEIENYSRDNQYRKIVDHLHEHSVI